MKRSKAVHQAAKASRLVFSRLTMAKKDKMYSSESPGILGALSAMMTAARFKPKEATSIPVQYTMNPVMLSHL